VRQDHGVDAGGVKGEFPVADKSLLAGPLIQTAVQQQPLALNFNQVHGAGYGPGRAPELYVHSDSDPYYSSRPISSRRIQKQVRIDLPDFSS
jgi:hypothetical protein